MKTLINTFLLTANVFALFICVAAYGADNSQLDTFKSIQIRSYLSGNAEVIADYLADEVRLMPAYQHTVLGKENAMTYHEAFLERFTVSKYTRTRYEVLDIGTRVIELGQFTMDVVLKKTGEPQQMVGKYLDIWERSEQGTLLLNTVAWNYDEQIPIAAELRFPQVPSVIMAHQARVPVNNAISFELAALGKLHESAISQNDWAVWAQFFTDDTVLFANHGTIIAGRKAMNEYLDMHSKEMPVFEKLDIRTDRIDDLGKYVVEYSTHVANWRTGDYSGVNTGKNIRFWRREANGSLKVFRSIGMYD